MGQREPFRNGCNCVASPQCLARNGLAVPQYRLCISTLRHRQYRRLRCVAPSLKADSPGHAQRSSIAVAGFPEDKMLKSYAHLNSELDMYRRAWAATVQGEAVLDAPTLRTAAYAVALRRCRQATEQRGIWPNATEQRAMYRTNDSHPYRHLCVVVINRPRVSSALDVASALVKLGSQ